MKKYNWSVASSRIAATMMIVLCHLFSKLGIGWLGSIFDVGVPIFLIISGFLYGGRTYTRYKAFLLETVVQNMHSNVYMAHCDCMYALYIWKL